MSGDSRSACWNPQDFTLILLQACTQLGKAPEVDWRMEMTPVDFAANFIVKMIRKSSQAMGKTFHIINDKPLQSRFVVKFLYIKMCLFYVMKSEIKFGQNLMFKYC
jgi:thioester reductase-like protein